jgi:dolichol-phosphate mannosyltransferase
MNSVVEPRSAVRSVVVIPTYCEAANVTTVLDGVLAAAPGTDVLVVDDNSPDGTAARVRSHPQFRHRVHLLERPGKAGLGAAYRAGFSWALIAGYEALVQMDADLSHPPERVPALLRALGHADVVVGSRYVAGGAVRDWPWQRRLISWAGNVYVRLVLDLPVHDTTAGFKAFRRDALLRIGVLESVSNGYCFQIENTWRACRAGLVVSEVPITFSDRGHGESKMSPAIVREALGRVLVWRWHELTGVAVPGRPAAEPAGRRDAVA